MSQQKQAALSLARMGYRVFPLIPGDKKPAIQRFPIAATNDETQIEMWWRSRPDYNVGVSTTGFIVVDVDTKHGPQAMENFKLLGCELNTFTVRTASGGFHCYYNGPDSQQVAGLVPFIDIRSHHGYVVGPGSITSSKNEGCVDGEYAITLNLPRADCPVAVEIMLNPPGHRRERDDHAELDVPYNIKNAAAWLDIAEVAIEGHGGNAFTYQICARLVRDFALTAETAYQLLINHWNERCIPPWSPAELMTLVRNAENYGTGDLGKASPDRTFGAVIVPPNALPAVEEPKFRPIGFVRGNATPRHEMTARPWKVHKLMMNGDLTVLGGMGSAGKSSFQLIAAAHYALGKDFGPFKLAVPGMPLCTVIYNSEDDIKEQSLRLDAICTLCNFDYDVVRQNLVLMDDRQGELNLTYLNRNVLTRNEAAIEFMIETARGQRADLIDVDPLVSLHACNENDNSHMRYLASTLRLIARETNTAILAAHHTSKGNALKEKGDADAFRGASALIDAARIGILMSRLTTTDKGLYGVSQENARDYIRIDIGKTNTFRQENEATAVLHWQAIHHHTGEIIAALELVDMTKKKADNIIELVTIIRDALRAGGKGAMHRSDAAKAIRASNSIQSKFSETHLRDTVIPPLFIKPVQIGDDVLMMIEVDGQQLIQLR